MKTTMTSRDLVVESLRKDILTGTIKPRERLIEEDLSELYQVSRTPIREAINLLSAFGLIEVIPYKGAFVADVDVESVREIYQVRVILEGEAAFLAAKQMTDEILNALELIHEELIQVVEERNNPKVAEKNEAFHQLIYENCGNREMAGIIETLFLKTAIFRHTTWHSTEKNTQIVQYHREILDALWKKDAGKAREITQHHILYSLEN